MRGEVVVEIETDKSQDESNVTTITADSVTTPDSISTIVTVVVTGTIAEVSLHYDCPTTMEQCCVLADSGGINIPGPNMNGKW